MSIEFQTRYCLKLKIIYYAIVVKAMARRVHVYSPPAVVCLCGRSWIIIPQGWNKMLLGQSVIVNVHFQLIQHTYIAVDRLG